jgi:deoxyuridine 5'-triphosphate nucleotidohydrolase
MHTLKVYKKHSDVKNIEFGTEQSACFDISAYIPYSKSVKAYTKTNEEIEMLAVSENDGKSFIEIPHEWRVLIPTGLIFDIPDSHCIKIYARSGLSTKKGLNLINSTGVIDSDYVQELFIPIYNNSQVKIKIYNGDRIAQGQLEYVQKYDIMYVVEKPLNKSDRDGGFGSTGISC